MTPHHLEGALVACSYSNCAIMLYAISCTEYSVECYDFVCVCAVQSTVLGHNILDLWLVGKYRHGGADTVW